MRFTLCLIAGAVFMLSGCNIDAPLPPDSDSWKKSGADKIVVARMMLECGYQDSATGGHITMNESIEAASCMEQVGFRNTNMSKKEVCINWAEKDYPACRPGAPIPVPSAKKRLNSEMCRYYREHKAIMVKLGDVFTPAVCAL